MFEPGWLQTLIRPKKSGPVFRLLGSAPDSKPDPGRRKRLRRKDARLTFDPRGGRKPNPKRADASFRRLPSKPTVREAIVATIGPRAILRGSLIAHLKRAGYRAHKVKQALVALRKADRIHGGRTPEGQAVVALLEGRATR
jgi:hypothetical protein